AGMRVLPKNEEIRAEAQEGICNQLMCDRHICGALFFASRRNAFFSRFGFAIGGKQVLSSCCALVVRLMRRTILLRSTSGCQFANR
ncbi:MAG: hypothetical protein ACPGWR_14760, partial [Ardenticatenaceae bacterium]